MLIGSWGDMSGTNDGLITAFSAHPPSSLHPQLQEDQDQRFSRGRGISYSFTVLWIYKIPTLLISLWLFLQACTLDLLLPRRAGLFSNAP